MNALKKHIAVVISVIALIISAASLYFTSLKSANITLSVGEIFEISHKNNSLCILLPMVIHNTGAQSGVIHSMGVIIKDQRSAEAIFLKWQTFAKLTEYGQDRFAWVDESNATAVSVPARSDITKMAVFSGGESVAAWIPNPTTYDLYLLVWTSESEKPSIILPKSTWTFDENTVSEIKRNIKENNKENTSINRLVFGPNSKMLSTSEFNELIK